MNKFICLSTGKTGLPEKVAKKNAEKFRKVASNKYMKAYKCMFCSKWHLTHAKQYRH